jgi:hypothetical protein
VPENVGVKQASLVISKHSGRHAFIHKLKDLGYELAGNQLEDAFVRFKALADRKKQVYDEDIEAPVDTEIATAQDRIRLVSLSIIAVTHGFLPSCLSSPLLSCSHSDVVWQRVVVTCLAHCRGSQLLLRVRSTPSSSETCFEERSIHAITASGGVSGFFAVGERADRERRDRYAHALRS